MHKRRPSFTQCQQQYDNQLPPEDPQGDAEEAYWDKVDKETAKITKNHERTADALIDFLLFLNQYDGDPKVSLGYENADLHRINNAFYDLIGTPDIRAQRDKDHPFKFILDNAIRWQAREDIGPFNGRY